MTKGEKDNSNDPSDALILPPVVKKSSTDKCDFFQYPLIKSSLTRRYENLPISLTFHKNNMTKVSSFTL